MYLNRTTSITTACDSSLEREKKDLRRYFRYRRHDGRVDRKNREKSTMVRLSTRMHRYFRFRRRDGRVNKQSRGKSTVVGITGSSGIVGSRIYPSLLERGYDVVGISDGRDISQGGPDRPGEDEVRRDFVDRVCDVTDAAACEGVFDGCDKVIHLAAQGSPDASFEEVVRVNIVGTYNVLEEAKKSGVKRVVFASTNHVQHGFSMGATPETIDFSRLTDGQMRLRDPATPDSFYAVSKLCGEDLGKLYASVWGAFDFVALRIGWVLYDDPRELKGTKYEKYLRSMYLSRRDCEGYFSAALEAPIPDDMNRFMQAYAVSNNRTAVFDLEDTISNLGYTPIDSSDSFSWGG